MSAAAAVTPPKAEGGRGGAIWLRLAVLVLVVAALGLPITDLPGFGLLVVAALLVGYGRPSRCPWRWVAALGLAAATAVVPALLPTPRIEEGHNAFVVTGPGQALQAGLPPAVFAAMLAEFDAVAAAAQCDPAAPGCWRGGGVPDRPYALSGDALLQHPRASRIVTTIDHGDPSWARLGFVNEFRYNWFGGADNLERVERDRRWLAVLHPWHLRMPYFVMYEIPAALAGSRLCWRGELLWEQPEGRFETLRRDTADCRTLTAADAGSRIFGLAIQPGATLSIHLEPTAAVALWTLAAAALRLAGAAGLLLLLVRCPWRRLAWPAILVASAAVIALLVDASFLGGFRPHDGGDDGLVHEGFARSMLAHWVAGNVRQALMGYEPVYYFMPGLRYFHLIERFIFGDTNLGYLAAMLALPLLVWRLFRLFLPPRWAVVLTLAFVVTPLGGLFGSTFYMFVKNAARGYPDPLGLTLLLGGLLVVIEHLTVDRPRSVGAALLAGFVLAWAMFVRPNLGLSIAVLLAAAGLWLLWRRAVGPFLALCLGFAPVLLIPLHNWVYGSVFVPLTASATHWSTYLAPPATYAAALGQLARLDFGGAELAVVIQQFVNLLSGPSQAAVFIPLHVAALAVAVGVALSGRDFDPRLRLVAVVALAQQVVFLVWVHRTRYTLLAWLLVVLVGLVWLRRRGLPWMERRWPRLMWSLSTWRGGARFGNPIRWLERTAAP